MKEITTVERRQFTRLLKQAMGKDCKVKVLWDKKPIKYTQKGIGYIECKFRHSIDNYATCCTAIMKTKASSSSMDVYPYQL